jgi:hypothetical protein
MLCGPSRPPDQESLRRPFNRASQVVGARNLPGWARIVRLGDGFVEGRTYDRQAISIDTGLARDYAAFSRRVSTKGKVYTPSR